jgi:hypothetical protein
MQVNPILLCSVLLPLAVSAAPTAHPARPKPCKFEDGVYYRDAALKSTPGLQLHLADVPLPNGILRLDQNASLEAAPLRLGHYALPNLTGTIRRSTHRVQGHEVQLTNNGTYQLAMITLNDWAKLKTLDTNGLNPVQPSTLLNAATLPAG